MALHMYIFDKRQSLLGAAKDPNKLQKIRRRLSKFGKMTHGDLPDYNWAQQNLGHTYDKTLLASKGIEMLGRKNTSFTAIGGWCFLRTRDLQDIKEGYLVDPRSGLRQSYDSVEAVSNWITNVIALEQISQAIGTYTGKRYVVISERELWTRKITYVLEQVFHRPITQREKHTLKQAIIKAEKKHYLLTKRYLEYLKQDTVELTLVADEDLYNDLIKIRDHIFEVTGLSFEELQKHISPDQFLFQDKTRLQNHLEEVTTIWSMYTGSFFSLLRQRGYAYTPYGVFLEPWSHATGDDTLLKRAFNTKVFGHEFKKHAHLNPKGINHNLAQIALDQASDFAFKKSNTHLLISQTINSNNYIDFFEQPVFKKNLENLDLGFNPAFQLGFTYLSTLKKYRNTLLEMSQIQRKYRSEKLELKSLSQLDKKRAVKKLKSKYKPQLKVKSLKILEGLNDMTDAVFKAENLSQQSAAT